MISYDIMEKEAILIVTPQEAIKPEDFEAVSKDVDKFLENNGCLAGVIIYVRRFSGWKNFSALVNHFKFVKEHHKFIEKVAFVTDDKVLTFLPNIARHFVSSEIKHFTYGNRRNALDWINESRINKEHGISVEIDQIGDIFYIKMDMKGTLTHKDYELMIPIIEGAIKNVSHPKLKILVNSLELDGWELEAAWDDLKFGLKYNKEFEKIAFIGGKIWEEYIVKISSWFLRGEIKFFKDELSAKNWLKG